ncbi:MAG: (5-formylfuran-3-yl)methyl phosphate synthase [Candidatus Omnitrophota bacterium]
MRKAFIKQKLLISVRGPKEALEAVRGGAHIADVEYPASALGTPYPLNILAVRNQLDKAGFKRAIVSTNIGEVQHVRASSCQAALGVATAGADIIKCGLAELPFEAAAYLGDSLVRSVKMLYPHKKVIPAVFVDPDMQRFFNPLKEGPKLIKKIQADGLLIDTFNKLLGKGLLDYWNLKQVAAFVSSCHEIKKEAWIAGSIAKEELPDLWRTGVDVICIRGAACEQTSKGRFGEVKKEIVANLIRKS